MSEERRSGERRRTLALHGRNATAVSSMTPQSVAASNPCLNCGTNVQLEFCPECGQRAIDSDPSLREFAHELAGEFLHWDGKLFRTFRLLLTQPGELTCEYLAGRRVRYISPVRVYLTCSVLFFFLSALVPETQLDAQGRQVRHGVVQIGRSTPGELAALDSLGTRAEMPQRIWFAHFARAMHEPERVAASVQASIPRTMFVLVPVFAALLGMVYRFRRRQYPQHLAFALHEHAVLFLGLVAMLAARLVPNLRAARAFEILVAMAIAGHLVLATSRVYETAAAATVGRLALVGALYFAAFIGVLYAAFALTVLAF